MKKEDINYEFISNIRLQIDDTLFYIPGEAVKGKIIVTPKYQMKIKDKTLNISLRIIQYEFWENVNTEIKELKNVYTTKIQEEKFKYQLKDEEINEKQDIVNQELNFSIIEKAEENKKIIIPFQIILKNKNILPTFQYENDKYILGIRHLLIAECEEYNSSNYTGLFIGKSKSINEEFNCSKELKENYYVGLGWLEIRAKYQKLAYTFDEEINVDIKTDSNLYFKKITKITQTFYNSIKWVGYMKNSLLDKNIYNTQSIEYNKDKYGLVDKLTAPIRPAIESIEGGIMAGYTCAYPPDMNEFFDLLYYLDGSDPPKRKTEVTDNKIGISNIALRAFFGVIFVPVLMIGGFANGFEKTMDIADEVLKTKNYTNYMENNFKGKIINNEDKKILFEKLTKFVYFKDNKIVGFVKFGKNIIPPINGYFFNCDYNVKIEVNISGILLNRNKNLKTKIDLYDSEEYITNMKNIFRTQD